MARKYWKGGNAGVEGSWTEGGSLGTVLKVAAAVDEGDGIVRLETNAVHTFIKDDYVVINGTDSYDGNYRVVDVLDANGGTTFFYIRHIYVAETFAITDTVKSSNWQDEDGVPVAIPVAGVDEVIFDDSAGVATDVSPKHTEGKHWNCCDDIAIGDTGELELHGFTRKANYTGIIGANSENAISPLHISIADTYTMLIQGGVSFIECSADDVNTTINIPLLVYDAFDGCLFISSDVNDGVDKSEWDEIRCMNRGRLELADNTVCQLIRTYNSNITLVIGTGCVDTSDGNDPIDLYVGASQICSSIEASNKIETDGILNFGAAALKLVKGR